MRGGWSRRAVLSAVGGAGVASVLGAGGLGGCTGSDRSGARPSDPLESLLASAQALADGYEATLAAHPELTDQLRPLYDAHVAHVAALRQAIGRPELPTPSTDAGVWSLPIDDGATVAEAAAGLAEAERAGWQEARLACLSAPPARAALLGSIAAARATHVEVLT